MKTLKFAFQIYWPLNISQIILYYKNASIIKFLDYEAPDSHSLEA